MSAPELVNWVQLYLIEKGHWLRLSLLLIVAFGFVLGCSLADLTRYTLVSTEMQTLKDIQEIANDQKSAELFSDQLYVLKTERLARQTLDDALALQALVESSNDPTAEQGQPGTEPTALLGRLFSLQVTSYQARSQNFSAGAHSFCALQGVQHGPHGRSIACEVLNEGGSWVLKARNGQCSLICLN